MKPAMALYRCLAARDRAPARGLRLGRGRRGAVLGGARHLRETLEQRCERLELLLGEALGEEATHACEVAVGCRLEPLCALIRELRVDDARIGSARGFRHEAAALEAVQQSRDPGRRQENARREVDAPK